MFFLKPSEKTLRLSRFSSLRRDQRDISPWLAWWLVSILATAFSASNAYSQWIDDFEAGPTRWSFLQSDARARTVQQSRVSTMPHAGLSSEMIEVAAANQGTYLHIFYPLERPLAIIDELTCRLWIRAASSGMRPAFRVIFPQTSHPATHDPLTTLLYGSPSLGGGEWSETIIANPIALLEAQRRVLKAQYGAAIDLRSAYVDGIVIDVYNGPGNTKLQIDDLRIDGAIDAEVVQFQRPTAAVNDLGLEPTDPAIQIAEAARDLRASVPRWLQYRGENLDWLASLGINGLVVEEVPSPDFLRDAARLELSVISPLPNLLPPAEQWPLWNAVRAWTLGWSLDQSQLDATRDLISQLNTLPPALRKPVVLEALEAYGQYGRLADVVAVPLPLPTTISDHDEAELILRDRVDAVRGRTLPLMSVSLEPAVSWTQQRDELARAIGSNAASIPPYDHTQARQQIMRSVAHGARGWYFRSQTPLDETDPYGLVRAESLRAINAEIRLMAPWLQSGEPGSKLAIDLRSGYTGYRIAMPRSELILLVARGPNDSAIVPSLNLPQLSLALPRNQSSSQIYRISRGQLESVAARPSANGWQLQIPNPSNAELLVVTEDARAINFLQRILPEIAPWIAESRLSAAEQSVQIAELALSGEQVALRNSAWTDVALAQSSLRGAEQFLERSDLLRCVANADASAAIADRLVQDSWNRARLRFPATNSTPLLASRLGLPLHWDLDRVIRDRTWQPIPVPDGNFEKLQPIFDSGWSIDRRLESTVRSQVAAISGAGQNQSAALLLEAASLDNSPLPGGYAGASMRIASPKLAIPTNALVHLEGLVKIVDGATEAQCGVLAYETNAGPALGQLASQRTGTNSSWQRIDLYRFNSDPEGVQFIFELRGSCRILLDDLRAEYLMPNPVSDYETFPVSVPE